LKRKQNLQKEISLKPQNQNKEAYKNSKERWMEERKKEKERRKKTKEE